MWMGSLLRQTGLVDNGGIIRRGEPMTARLEKAIRQLPPEKIRQLEEYAESLADTALNLKAKPPKLDWVGAASGLGKKYADGVEAAHDATRIRIEKATRAH